MRLEQNTDSPAPKKKRRPAEALQSLGAGASTGKTTSGGKITQSPAEFGMSSAVTGSYTTTGEKSSRFNPAAKLDKSRVEDRGAADIIGKPPVGRGDGGGSWLTAASALSGEEPDDKVGLAVGGITSAFEELFGIDVGQSKKKKKQDGAAELLEEMISGKGDRQPGLLEDVLGGRSTAGERSAERILSNDKLSDKQKLGRLLSDGRVTPVAALDAVTDPVISGGGSPVAIGGGYAQTMPMPVANPVRGELIEADKRDALLNVDLDREKSEKKDGDKREVDPMTWEEYNSLTDRQRAAVDFNSMLVRAVRKDKRLNKLGKYDPTGQQKHGYNVSVSKMFGKEGGSDLFAPETVSVLKQIDYEDTGADLDNFLNLKEAITEDDIRYLVDNRDVQGHLTLSKDAPPVQDPDHKYLRDEIDEFSPLQKERLENVEELAEKTHVAIEGVLDSGKALLADVRGTMAAARADDVVNTLGGRSPFLDENRLALQLSKQPVGYSNAGYDGIPGTNLTLQNSGGLTADDLAKANVFFQRTYDQLASKNTPGAPEETMAVVQETLANAGVPLSEWVNYVQSRISASEGYDTSLGRNKTAQYRTPEEYRELLKGLGLSLIEQDPQTRRGGEGRG